jgi:TonB family protein
MRHKFRFRAAGIATLSLLLGGIAVMPAPLGAQNVSAEAGSRKVRSRVVPAYPDVARQSHVTGKVRLEATVSADGTVRSIKVIGGSPLLVSAATDALNKWRFEAAASETTETVSFEFNGLN